jgi:Zn-dependent protease with chaperone function
MQRGNSVVVFVGLVLFSASGCATSSNSAVAHTYLEAKAIEYHRAQEARVHAVGLKLLSVIPNPPHVAFIVEPGNPVINAGTTYGKVMLTSAIVQFTKTDDELAVLIGHELAHHTRACYQPACE